MYSLVLLIYTCFISNLALNGQAVSEKIFEYYGDIHVYCPGMGADQALGSKCFRITNLQSIFLFLSSFSLQMLF